MINNGVKVENQGVNSNLKTPFQSEEPKSDALAGFVTGNNIFLLNVEILEEECAGLNWRGYYRRDWDR